MRVKALLPLALCAALGPSAGAAPKTAAATFAEAESVYQQGYYTRALGLLQSLVNKGDAHAMVLLGRMYEEGKGTAKDPAQAAKLYGRANARRDLEGRYRLSMLYFAGTGVDKDPGRALRMLQGAAKEGYPPAETQLGLLYSQGDLLGRDYGAAVSWYEKAAASGDAEAQYSLGLMYDSGIGLPQQEVNAAQWLRLAAEQGHARSQYLLGLMYAEDSHLGPKKPVEAYAWLALAAQNGVAEAKQKLGEMASVLTASEITEGAAETRKKEEAIREAASASGESKAAKAVAAVPLTPAQQASEAFSRGRYDKAFDLGKPLAEQGDPEALFLLGVMYDGGFQVGKDAARAFQYMKQAADADFPAAEFSLGVTYECGLRPAAGKNPALAYFWYSLASSHGDEDANDKVVQLAKVLTPADVDAEKAQIRAWRADHERRKRMGVEASSGAVAETPGAAASAVDAAALSSLGIDTRAAAAIAVSTVPVTSHAFDFFDKR